jgi:hypothetical protein
MSNVIAALFVDAEGPYAEVDGLDLWPIERDARRYAGPWPVVAHPPCARWCAIAELVESLGGPKAGEDDGCFEAALASVRAFGGVLEHPAHSRAWSIFGLPRPGTGGWSRSLLDRGWVTEVDQAAYGHRARKRTWLYFNGPDPLPLDWSRPPVSAIVSSFQHCERGAHDETRRVRPAEAARTPTRFRDVLLDLAAAAAPSSHQRGA